MLGTIPLATSAVSIHPKLGTLRNGEQLAIHNCRTILLLFVVSLKWFSSVIVCDIYSHIDIGPSSAYEYICSKTLCINSVKLVGYVLLANKYIVYQLAPYSKTERLPEVVWWNSRLVSQIYIEFRVFGLCFVCGITHNFRVMLKVVVLVLGVGRYAHLLATCLLVGSGL